MTDTDPRPLTDAELLAWAVILGYREQQYARGNNIILLPYPPCPTCGGDVSGVTTYQRRDQFDSRLTTQPCEHEHAVDEVQMERIYWHIGDMMQLLDTASRWPAGEGWNTERIIADARARVGEPEATEATEPSDPTECSGEAGPCPEHGHHEDSLKQPAEASAPARCCVCGGGQVVYRNYLEQPFCGLCANCECGQNPCVRTGVGDPAVSEAAEVERLRRMVRQLMTVNRATVTRVEALATRIAAGHPVQDNATSLAAAIREAARGGGPLEKAGD